MVGKILIVSSKEEEELQLHLIELGLGCFCPSGLGLFAERVGKRDISGGGGFLREVYCMFINFNRCALNYNKAKGLLFAR